MSKRRSRRRAQSYGILFLVSLLVTLATSPGCQYSAQPRDSDYTGQTRQAVTGLDAGPIVGSDPVSCATWGYAVVANNGNVILNAETRVDSYESSLGPYGGTNVGAGAIVQAATSVTDNGGTVNGSVRSNAPAGFSVLPVPVGAINLPLGSTAPGSLYVNDARSNVTLSPGDYVAANINVNYPGSITVSPGGPVRIWVTGSLNLGGNENLNGSPENLAFLVTSSASVNVNSNGSLFGLLYAPTSPVTVNSAIFGTVIGSSVTTLNSQAAVHSDQSSVLTCAANAALGQLEHQTGVVWQSTLEPETPYEVAVYLRPSGDPGITLPAGTQPQTAANTFLQNYGAIFRIQNPATQLALDQAHIGSDGIGYAAYQQVVNGVPVLGGRVTFMFNPQGRIDNIFSHIIAGVGSMSTTPRVEEAKAVAIGQADMATRFPSGTLGATLPTRPSMLFVAPQAGGPPRLARAVTALFADQVNPLIHYGRNYIIDALAGTIIASGNADRGQYRGTGGPVPATARGSIEQNNKSAVVKQFTAFSAKPPTGAPFFMQPSVSPPIYVLDGALKVASVYQPVESDNVNVWDTGISGAGAAVDAYVYSNYALAWWAQRGRSSYDNHGAIVPIIVHFPNLNCNSEFTADGNFEFGDCENSMADLPASAALDDVGHEFQHAVNSSVLAGGGTLFYATALIDPDLLPLDESLGDVFGQFIEADFSASTPLAYAATPSLFGEAEYALNPGIKGPWVRNLVSPHLPSEGNAQYIQPDSMADCLYSRKNDEHINAGIPNRAWSIATLGGADSTSGFAVDATASLGMSVSEQLYLTLIQNPPSLGSLQSGADFKAVARALIAFARMKYGFPLGPVTALACAWVGVNVLTSSDAIGQGVDVFSACAEGPVTPCITGGTSPPTGTGCGMGSALASCAGTPCKAAPAGAACSADGTTVYSCDGQGGTIGGTFCTSGCLPNTLGLAACAGATGPGAGGGSGPCFSLLPGSYCGGNGSGNPSILYTCSNNSIVSAVSCGSGCEINPVAGGPPVPPPGCSGGGSASCFGLPAGNYCGDDKVCGDPNVLYHCDANQNATVSAVCATGCSIHSALSQAGGADQCTGPYGNRAGVDSCNPGSQVSVSPGSSSSTVGAGAYGTMIMGSGVVCSEASEGLVGVPNLHDGLYCGLNGTITYCREGVDQEVRMCPAGCVKNGKVNGGDTCSGVCAGVLSGTACASDGVTLYQCDLSVRVAQSTCPSGDVCGGVPAKCGPPCVQDSDCSTGLICRKGACEAAPSVTFRLSHLAFATTTDTNCKSPPSSQDQQAVSGLDASGSLTFVCNPIVNADGSYSKTAQATTQQVACGDGHGAVVQVSCNGDGVAGDVVQHATVEISISPQCGTSVLDTMNTQLVSVSLPRGASLPTQPIESCDSFSTACMGCNFNSFSAELQVSANH